VPRGKKSRSLSDRLWSRVNMSGPIHPVHGRCWEWTGWREGDGRWHGRISVGGTGGRLIGAHRASWMVTFGPIPNGLGVLHKCDNPGCVRPDHLFLGTNTDNNADMVSKGRNRWLCGEDNRGAKLTTADVAEIRRRLACGDRQKDIAKDFSIIQAHVSRIGRGASWAHQRSKEESTK